MRPAVPNPRARSGMAISEWKGDALARPASSSAATTRILPIIFLFSFRTRRVCRSEPSLCFPRARCKAVPTKPAYSRRNVLEADGSRRQLTGRHPFTCWPSCSRRSARAGRLSAGGRGLRASGRGPRARRSAAGVSFDLDKMQERFDVLLAGRTDRCTRTGPGGERRGDLLPHCGA